MALDPRKVALARENLERTLQRMSNPFVTIPAGTVLGGLGGLALGGLYNTVVTKNFDTDGTIPMYAGAAIGTIGGTKLFNKARLLREGLGI